MPHIKERIYTSLNIYHTHRGGGAQSFERQFASFISITGATQIYSTMIHFSEDLWSLPDTHVK